MAYAFQSFTFEQVLTSAQMNQVEVNIRDHVHGKDGVSNAPTLSIESQTASADASLDFTTSINSSFSEYMLMLKNVKPANDDVGLRLRVSDDGGSTWRSGASDYGYVARQLNEANNADSESSASATFIALTQFGTAGRAVGNAAAESGVSGWIRFFSPSSTTLDKVFRFALVYQNATASEVTYVSGAGRLNDTVAIDGVQLFFESGNIASGEVSLIGVR